MGPCITMQEFNGCETVGLEMAVYMKSGGMVKWSRFEGYRSKYDGW